MKVIGINGSPRKKNNTATMLDFALEGAKSMGAEVEKFNLYDLRFTGCASCFACKLIGGASHGRCALRDDLSPVLDKIRSADALILATPIYFGDVSGMTRCFLERLWFPSLMYRADGEVAYNKKLKNGIIYTMNVEDPYEYNYDHMFSQNESMFEQYVGETKSICATDTYQYGDYSKFESGIFDPQHKLEVHNSQFPKDCERAYALGAELVK
ncbi:MAG: flavodoxin family protein [Monoglobaceae bacterium]